MSKVPIQLFPINLPGFVDCYTMVFRNGQSVVLNKDDLWDLIKLTRDWRQQMNAMGLGKIPDSYQSGQEDNVEEPPGALKP